MKIAIYIITLLLFFYPKHSFSVNNIDDLPSEMTFQILDKLSFDEIINVSKTSENSRTKVIEYVKNQKVYLSEKFGISFQYLSPINKVIIKLKNLDSINKSEHSNALSNILNFVNEFNPAVTALHIEAEYSFDRKINEQHLAIISKMSELTDLSIGDIAKEASLASLSQLKKLSTLNIRGGVFKEEDINSFQSKNLKIFSYNSTVYNYNFPKKIYFSLIDTLKFLEELIINDVLHLNDLELSHLGNLNHLKNISLNIRYQNQNFDGEFLNKIRQLNFLSLHFSEENPHYVSPTCVFNTPKFILSKEFFANMTTLQNLKKIDLQLHDQLYADADDFKGLNKLTQLENFSTLNVNLTEAFYDNLFSLENLKNISIMQAHPYSKIIEISQNTFLKILKLKDIEILNILSTRVSSNLFSADIKNLVEKFPNLKNLGLNLNYTDHEQAQTDAVELVQQIGRLNHLVTLKLIFSPDINCTVFKNFANMPKLTSLSLDGVDFEYDMDFMDDFPYIEGLEDAQPWNDLSKKNIDSEFEYYKNAFEEYQDDEYERDTFEEYKEIAEEMDEMNQYHMIYYSNLIEFRKILREFKKEFPNLHFLRIKNYEVN